MKNKILILTVAVLLSLASISAKAAFIIDTGNPNNDANYVFNTEGIFGPKSQSVGFRISFTESYNITDISSYFNSDTSTGITMSLFTDSSGTLGTQLYSQSFSFSAPSTLTWAGLSGINWQVTAGNNYWLTYEPTAGDTSAGTAQLKRSSTSFPVIYNQGFGWTSLSSSTHSLVVEGNSVPAIPEPETYGVWLAGFGLMGFIARRRKNTQA